MVSKARLLTGVAAVGLAVIGASAVGALPAAASSSSVTASPAKGLLTAAQAEKLGFAKAAGKPMSSSKTGVSGCAKGAEVAFEDTKGATGLIAEVLVCSSTKGPASVLKNVKAATTSAPLTPPRSLGPTAVEKATDGNTYAIYWQRGKILELVAYDANVPASASSTTTTSVPAPPLTAAQQQILSKAALQQDATVK